MEQRIGPSSQPLKGAGFDPAFIPGLTSPESAEPEEDARPRQAEPTAPDDTESDRPEAAVDMAKAEKPAEPEAADGPVFEAADRRARIVADRNGVRLSLDEEACEFGWHEIGAVETEPARFGKRFTVTVHTPDRRWYPIEIEAPARSHFKAWEDQLDAVLDAYFEDAR